MSQENGPANPDDVRGKAVKRLAVAGLVTAAALGALWWLDHSGAERPSARKLAAKPAPITPATASANTAPAEEPSPPGVSPALTTSPGLEQKTGPSSSTTPAAPEANVGTDAPPPAPRVNNAPVAPPSRPSAAPSPSSPASAPPLPALAASDQFVVQLGVFHDIKSAQDMVRKLNMAGIRARIETRVQVGPFQDKAEADRALEAMRRQGFTGVVEIPALVPRK